MRIVHLITRLIIGGAQENTVLSCEELHARGHEVHLWSGPTTGPEGSLVARASHGGYAYEEFPDLIRSVSPSHDLRALKALRKRLEEVQPDIVHTHSSKAGVIGRTAATRAGMPSIVHTIHGMSFNRTQRLWTRAAYALTERFCSHRCQAIVSVADAMTRQALAAGIGTPEQYETIRSGMETDAFDPQDPHRAEWRARWQVGEQDVLVGTVARLFANKGYEQLIEIMALALEREPRLRFVWVGGGDHQVQYEAELARRGLKKRVHLTGLVKPEEIPGILSAVDILAHTSQWEGLPRAVVQAMLMEKPAVSFAIDGAPEIVRPGETGELVDLGDLPGFAEALVTLAGEQALRAEYGRRGRKECLQMFDHRVMVDRLENLYKRLVSLHHGKCQCS